MNVRATLHYTAPSSWSFRDQWCFPLIQTWSAAAVDISAEGKNCALLFYLATMPQCLVFPEVLRCSPTGYSRGTHIPMTWLFEGGKRGTNRHPMIAAP